MMLNLKMNQKIILSIALLFSLFCSMATTFSFENDVTDGVSIAVSVFICLAIVVVFSAVILETLESICNP